MNIVHYVAVRIELYDMYNDYELNARGTNRGQIEEWYKTIHRWMVCFYEWTQNGSFILGHMLQTNQLND